MYIQPALPYVSHIHINDKLVTNMYYTKPSLNLLAFITLPTSLRLQEAINGYDLSF
jgi:hypothetical protein